MSDPGDGEVKKHKVLYLPTATHTKRVFTPEKFAELTEEFDVTINQRNEAMTTEELAEVIGAYQALITGWGATPELTAEVMENADQLQIIAHSAGSVKHFVSQEIVERYLRPRGIVIFSGADAIAYNVAESTVGMMIMTARGWLDHARYVRETGGWRSPELCLEEQYLMGATIGVVSASMVGRHVLRLLEPWDCQILLYDPYVSAQEAEALGAEKVELDELFKRSQIVTVHAPSIPETYKMIGAQQLRLLRDGATLVNTSRGTVIDEQALVQEAERLRICLDVTDPEPPAPDSPLRQSENIILLPHISGTGAYGYHKIGEATVQALRDHFAGRPVQGAVDYDRFAILA